jgi:hypothetical protein
LNKIKARVILALISMNTKVKSELKNVLPLVGSLLPFFVGAIISLSILPESCSLFGNPQGSSVCHTLPMPGYCCVDMMRVFKAQIIFGFGTVVSVSAFIAFSIILMKDSQNHSDNQPTLFN